MKFSVSFRRGGMGWSVLNICLALLAAGQLPAQNPTLKTRTKEQREREFLEARRITLNVQVEDGSGKPVPDLAAADFTVFDNDQPRKIAGMHMIDGEAMNDATEVMIVLDAVNSPAQELQQEREAIFNYLAHGHGQLPYPTSFGLWFNGHLKGAAPTTDRNALGKAFVSLTKNLHSNACGAVDASVEKVAAKPDGQSSESVSHCLQVHFKDSLLALDGIAQQQRTIGGRTILIWVGPGWPPLTALVLEEQSAKERNTFLDERATLLRDLRDAQITIDALTPMNGTNGKDDAAIDLKKSSTDDYHSRYTWPESVSLPVLSALTGGRAFTNSRDIGSDLNSCIRDADGYYALLFEAMPARSPHEFHRLEVKVKRPGLEVRTMTAYYAEP